MNDIKTDNRYISIPLEQYNGEVKPLLDEIEELKREQKLFLDRLSSRWGRIDINVYGPSNVYPQVRVADNLFISTGSDDTDILKILNTVKAQLITREEFENLENSAIKEMSKIPKFIRKLFNVNV